MANHPITGSLACNFPDIKTFSLQILWQISLKHASGHVKSWPKEDFRSEDYGNSLQMALWACNLHVQRLMPHSCRKPACSTASNPTLPAPVGDPIAQSKARSQGTVRCVTDDEHPVL
jgi:hypothetical protein